MRSPDVEDLQLLDLSAAGPAYAPLSAPDGAMWPRAVVRFHQGWWTAKVWLLPGVPARRKGLLLAGMYSDRAAAFRYAWQQVGIMRGSDVATTRREMANAAAVAKGILPPKDEAPC